MSARFTLSVLAPDLAPERLLSVPWSSRGRCFFSAPDGLSVAGLGEAAVLEADGPDRIAQLGESADRLLARLVDCGEGGEAPVLVGGFGFSGERASLGPWAGWAAGRLVLPEVALVERDGTRSLVAVSPEGMDIDAARPWLEERLAVATDALRSIPAEPDPREETVGVATRASWGFIADAGRDDRRPRPMAASSGGLGLVPTSSRTREAPLPDDPYEELVADGLAAIAAGRLDKVTLARSRRFGRVRRTAPGEVLGAFARHYPRCFRFWIEPADRPAFAGASPERLVARRGTVARADALAGTVGRSDEPAADANLGALLLANNTERREHDAVVDFLRERLGGFAAPGGVTAAAVPGLRKLANVQHLHTPFTVQLPDEATPGIMELASAVHPTPAVAGVPADGATRWIGEHEDLDRGWYAGGVGVVERGGDGELCVAIRSGLFEKDALWLFAGAGVVAGSDPSREAREVEQKMRALRDLLVEG